MNKVEHGCKRFATIAAGSHEKQGSALGKHRTSQPDERVQLRQPRSSSNSLLYSRWFSLCLCVSVVSSLFWLDSAQAQSERPWARWFGTKSNDKSTPATKQAAPV